MNETPFIKDIQNYANALKLNAIKSDIEEAVSDATANDLGYDEFLCSLLQKEYDIRQYNLTQSRIKAACFPYKKYLEDIVIQDLPKDAQNKLKHLNSLKFVKDGQNVILSGNPGTGKTHSTNCF